MRGLNTEQNKKLIQDLGNKFSGWLGSGTLRIEENRGIVVAQVAVVNLLEFMQYLRDNAGFDMLMDLTAVDYSRMPSKKIRFEIVYLLLSMQTLSRIRIKVALEEGVEAPSVTPIWKGANWPEREVFDFFGIRFSEHPLMERIIMPDNFRGHPLRKEFPLEGIGEDYLIEDILLPAEKEKMKIGFIDNI